MTISLTDVRERARTLLQDTDYVRWTKHELNNYINDSVEELVRQIKIPQVEETVTLVNGTAIYSLPSGLMDIQAAEWHTGQGVPILTDSEMRRMHAEGRLPETTSDSYNPAQVIFGTGIYTDTDWKVIEGSIPKGVVVDSRSAQSLRIYPVPKDLSSTATNYLTLRGTLLPTPMSDVVPSSYDVPQDNQTKVTYAITTTPLSWGGSYTNYLTDINGGLLLLESDSGSVVHQGDDDTDPVTYNLNSSNFTTSVDIPKIWEEGIVFGTLERAYLKEHDLRNVDKSEYFRNKKNMIFKEALDTEPINSAMITGGVNWNRFTVRHW